MAVPLPNGTEMIGAARSYSRDSAASSSSCSRRAPGTLRIFVTASGVRASGSCESSIVDRPSSIVWNDGRSTIYGR